MQKILIAILRAYRYLISPLLGPSCRFEPSCSVYALDAITQYGAVRGTLFVLRRVSRCHPWCAGGLDPVPPAAHRR